MPKNSRARAIADVSEGTIIAAVEMEAPPERVFRALSSKEISEWWGSPAVYQTTEGSGELRVGGRWRAVGRGADGHDFSVEGEFLEIDPPRKLVQTWKPSWDSGGATKVTYRLEAIEGGTRLVLRHEGFADADSCRNHSGGWE